VCIYLGYGTLLTYLTLLKAKFHYAIWSQTGSKLVLLARASSLLAS